MTRKPGAVAIEPEYRAVDVARSCSRFSATDLTPIAASVRIGRSWLRGSSLGASSFGALPNAMGCNSQRDDGLAAGESASPGHRRRHLFQLDRRDRWYDDATGDDGVRELSDHLGRGLICEI